MSVSACIVVALIAFFHFYILWFEMFAWTSRGAKVFSRFPQELFPQTKALAANLGLYNGFLAAGLVWSLLIADVLWQQNVALFFLFCVAVAGVFGAITADKKILFVQALPALIGIVLILFKI